MASWMDETQNALEIADDLELELSTPDDLDQELPDAEPAELISHDVEWAGRVFTIGEPDVETILALLNWVGNLGMRAARQTGVAFRGIFDASGKQVQSPAEATLYSLLATISPSDLGKLMAITFFGGSRDNQKAGLEWIGSLEPNQVRLAPLVQALQYRIAQAEDLRIALKNFQRGLAIL